MVPNAIGGAIPVEIMHDDSDKRTILVAFDDNAVTRDHKQHLQQDFKLLECKDPDDCLAVMREHHNELSAVIINVKWAKRDDYRFLRAVRGDTVYDTIPILISTAEEITEEDAHCLEEGAVDFLTPPYNSIITKARIANTLRTKRSTTFYEIESMLRELPSNIFLKDTEGRYVFCTHYWHHLDKPDDPNWTIRGKTDLEIRKDRENAIKAMEADKEIIRTGKGTSYVIEINTDGVQEFMELIKRPTFDKDGNVTGIIALINDVTEHELLKRDLEKRARTDELTGLKNHRAFEEFIRNIPHRDDFPIAVISADCDGLKMVNDTYGHLVGDEYLHMSAVVFQVSLPEDTPVFRTGGDEFIAFLPNTTQEQADEYVKTMRARQEMFKLKEGSLSISFGTGIINDPDESVRDVIAGADRAMYAAKSLRKNARA